jgi:hypothetical protein
MEVSRPRRSHRAKRPTLDVYRFPDLHLVAFILPLELLLVYCTLGDRHSAAETIRRFTGGWWTIKAAWLFVFIAHGGEAYYASKLCRRSSMGVINTVRPPGKPDRCSLITARTGAMGGEHGPRRLRLAPDAQAPPRRSEDRERQQGAVSQGRTSR